MKTWLKYGLVNFGISIFLLAIMFIFELEFLVVISILPMALVAFIARLFGVPPGFQLLGLVFAFGFVLTPVMFFIIGVVIGLIVTKMRNKKLK